MGQQLVSSVGLCLDIIGAVLVWRYGLPSEVDPEGRQFIAASDRDPNEVAKARVYRRLQHLGIGSLVVGFTLQLVGNWLR